MDTTATKEEPQIIDQWKKFKETRSLNQREMEPPPEEDEGEMSETEMLWKEMELAMASSYHLKTMRVQKPECPLGSRKVQVKFASMNTSWMKKLEFCAADAAICNTQAGTQMTSDAIKKIQHTSWMKIRSV
uniref:Uncharacterized protein n=1 Tax=Fagus sylvatica TaxID=28930 RepID=A0A2N9FRQ3_FAGSY